MCEKVHLIGSRYAWDLLTNYYDSSNIYIDVIPEEIGACPFYKVLLNGLFLSGLNLY